MKKVFRITLKIIEGELDIIEDEIFPYREKAYETVNMYKGYQRNIEGEPISRRIYKDKMQIPYISLKPGQLIELNGEFGYVYALKENIRKGKNALLSEFLFHLEEESKKVETFFDIANDMKSKAEEIIKYS